MFGDRTGPVPSVAQLLALVPGIERVTQDKVAPEDRIDDQRAVSHYPDSQCIVGTARCAELYRAEQELRFHRVFSQIQSLSNRSQNSCDRQQRAFDQPLPQLDLPVCERVLPQRTI